ncbi:MAG: hypothetical protein LZF61_07430 [Nitrosomonas sp.]|nr:MAG: hypothetical protein LZF61_07430 [Nitrosomonas sp.]
MISSDKRSSRAGYSMVFLVSSMLLLSCSAEEVEGIKKGTVDKKAEAQPTDKIKDSLRFNAVNVRTWAAKDNANNFPELTDSIVAVPWIKSRPSFGIAFSGGSTRSATATLGQLRALDTLGWLDQARYLSVNSGSSWISVPYVFLPEQFDGGRFLGSYISPGNIRDAVLKDEEDNESMEGAIFHARVVDPSDPERIRSMLRGDEGYADFVGEVFLKRFNLHDRNKFFSSHEAALDAILQSNPLLKSDDFYLMHKNRPFLIVIGTLLTPAKESYLIEATPLYVGLHSEFSVASAKDADAKRMLIGGGYIESFGYDSYEPKQAVSADGRWNVQLKGDVSRGDPLTNKRYRFTLSDVIGMSSAAPHITIAKKKIPDTVFPEFRHWAIDREHVQSDAQLYSKAKELKHGDGGDTDNLALIPLLARQIENILVFINTRTAFPADASCDNITTDVIVDDLIYLFRSTNKPEDKVVFSDGEVQLAKLCHDFKQKKQVGKPLAYCQNYVIKSNVRYGIREENYTPSICWVYLDRTQQWIDKIPNDHTEKQVTDLKVKQGDFEHFPHYQTFGEQGPLLIDLDRERVRALSNLTAWTVYESASYIAQGLPSALLAIGKRPEGFDQ